MKDNHSDVAIIGAGPAGSVAAHRLALAGLKVALIDRSIFPRDKSCGDGVGSKGLDVLDRMNLGDWASQFLAPENLRISSPDGTVLDVTPASDFTFGRVIPRLDLDNKLVEEAVKAGADLVEKTRVENVQCNGSGKVVIQAGSNKYTSKMLILADGSHAPVTKKLGYIRHSPDLYAIRQYYRGDSDQTKRIEFHFQEWIVPGYTWVFPLDNGVANIGTGTFAYRLKSKQIGLRDFLDRFITEQRHNGGRFSHASPMGGIKGHPLRTQLGQSITHASNILVIGDAAGLVNPLSGEGISSGMESAEMAVKQILTAFQVGDFSEKFLSSYTRNLMRHFAPDWRAARLFRQVLKKPKLINRIFHHMQQDHQRALLFVYLLLNHIPQRKFLRPGFLLKLLS